MPRKGTVKVVDVWYRKPGAVNHDNDCLTMPFDYPESDREHYYVRASELKRFINGRTDAIDRLIRTWFITHYVDAKLVTKAGGGK